MFSVLFVQWLQCSALFTFKFLTMIMIMIIVVRCGQGQALAGLQYCLLGWFYRLWQLRRMRRPSLDSKSAATLVHAFVTSRINQVYYNILLYEGIESYDRQVTASFECGCTSSDAASRRHLRSASRHHLAMSWYNLSTLGYIYMVVGRSFAVLLVRLHWNSLSVELRDPALSNDKDQLFSEY